MLRAFTFAPVRDPLKGYLSRAYFTRGRYGPIATPVSPPRTAMIGFCGPLLVES
jgi:hypothetical protein